MLAGFEGLLTIWVSLTTNKKSSVRVAGLLWGESVGDMWIGFTKCQSMRKKFPCHGVVMSIRNTLDIVNSLTDGRHFAYNIFKGIFMNEKYFNLIRISPNFVPKDPIDNKSALVQVITLRRTGDKPLPEPFVCTTMHWRIYAAREEGGGLNNVWTRSCLLCFVVVTLSCMLHYHMYIYAHIHQGCPIACL